jgi:uncharacterized membrane protein YqjE
MNSPLGNNLGLMAGTSKRLVSRVLAIMENRLELLTVEVHEAREHLLLALLLALGLAVFGLLAGIALTVAVVVMFWEHSPLVALLILMAAYLGGAAALYVRLQRLRCNWETLPATLDQMRRDFRCVENILR